MHIIAAIGGDPDLARFYEVDWQVIPNLMMDMVLPVLVRVMSIYQAGQIYTIASFVLIATGTFALNRQLHGRWSVLPLVAFPLLYNYVFLVGTMNYVFGIGLSLWALTAWVALRERGLPVRLAVSTLFVLGLFFCHLYALGIYGVGLVAYELHRLGLRAIRRFRPQPAGSAGRTLASLILDFLAGGLPFLLVAPLLMMSPTWGLRGAISWEWAGKLDGLIYAVNVYSEAVAFGLVVTAEVVVGFALWYRVLRVPRLRLVLLAVGAAVYVAMPRVDLRYLHGGPAAADLAGVHGDRLRAARSAPARPALSAGAAGRDGRPDAASGRPGDRGADHLEPAVGRHRVVPRLRSIGSTAAPRCWSPMRIRTAATMCAISASCMPPASPSSSVPRW